MYDEEVLKAIAGIASVLATRQRNLWPDDVNKLEAALSVLDRLRKTP